MRETNMDNLAKNGCIVLCIVLCVFVSGISCRDHVVEALAGRILGSIQGVEVYGENGSKTTLEYVQYLGIPYAEPPVGELRFMKPKPKPMWTETHNGTFYRPGCYQDNSYMEKNPIFMPDADYSEDCLNLDIYVPIGSTTGQGPYPVMIFLHGPGGSSKGFVGDSLSAFGDVIVVVVNFRLSILGFFSTGDSVVPGNYGLWDQHLAIKWVKNNIAAFRGDPDRITLAGYSVEASYAIFNAMYEGNSGLISRVIAQSGSPVPAYKVSSSLRQHDYKMITEAIGCGTQSSQEIVSCLRDKSVSELNDGLAAMTSSVTFTPVIDLDFIVGEPEVVLTGIGSETRGARDTFASVDLLTGIDNMEGGTHVALMWAEMLGLDMDSFQVNNSAFSDIVVPTSLDLIFGENVTKAITQLVTFEYSDITELDNLERIRDKVVELSTDLDFAVPAFKTVNLHSNLTLRNTYLYEFAAKLSLQTPLTPSWLQGANHGNDVYFMFGFSQRTLDAWSHTKSFQPTQMDIDASRRLMTLWTNFMKTGDPNSPTPLQEKWPDYSPETKDFFDISNYGASPRQHFREPAMTFWTQIVTSFMEMTPSSADREDDSEVLVEERSEKFHIDPLTADNIILTLIIMCTCVVCAFILLCAFVIARNSDKYSLKSV